MASRVVGPHSGADPPHAVRFDNVHKTYGPVQALNGLAVEFGAGDVTALLGPNGAGKTTMLEILTGIRVPDSGVVEVLGMSPVTQRTRLAQRIGVQVQEFSLQATVRVREALAFFASLHRQPDDVDDLIRRFGLQDKANARFPSLSGGQKRRLAIAKALVGRPELVVLDEPTSGLDPQGQQFLRRETRRLRDDGRTVLLSTHDVEDAERLAEAVVVIDQGRVVASGTPEKLVREQCLGWRAEVQGEPDPTWLEFDHSYVMDDDDGAAIVYAETPEGVRAVVGDTPIIHERAATLHDAYFKLTGSGLRS